MIRDQVRGASGSRLLEKLYRESIREEGKIARAMMVAAVHAPQLTVRTGALGLAHRCAESQGERAAEQRQEKAPSVAEPLPLLFNIANSAPAALRRSHDATCTRGPPLVETTTVGNATVSSLPSAKVFRRDTRAIHGEHVRVRRRIRGDYPTLLVDRRRTLRDGGLDRECETHAERRRCHRRRSRSIILIIQVDKFVDMKPDKIS